MASMLRQNLTCDICNTVYSEPVILPCMHTFCKHCITSLVSTEISPESLLHEVDSLDGEPDDVADKTDDVADKTDDVADKGPVIQCPTCYCISALENGVDSLPLNVTFDNITKKYRNNLKKIHRVFCDICDDVSRPVDATKSCVQCRLSYCNNCVENFHPSKGKLSKHTLCEPIPDISANVSDEEHLPGVDGDSKGAGLEIMENQLEKTKEEVSRRIKIAEADIDGFELEEKRRISEVQKSLNNLRSLIDEKEHSLVMQIKSDTVLNTKDRSTYIQELKTILSNVRQGICNIRDVLDDEFQNVTMEGLLETPIANRCKAIPGNLNHNKSESPKPYLDTKPIEELLTTLSFRQTGLHQFPAQFVYQTYIRQPNPQNIGFYGIPVTGNFPYQVPGQVLNNIPSIQQRQPPQLQNPTIAIMPSLVPQNVEKQGGNKLLLESMSPHERKQVLGEKLFPLVQQMYPDLAGKITGMLLEISDVELLQLLQSKEMLQQRVREADSTLQEHQRRKQTLDKENTQQKKEDTKNVQSRNEENKIQITEIDGRLQSPSKESASRPQSS
ncbi:hypothetical protein KUTeg_019096 [Tegillarca granosa]|uniref:Uncharacterized protein n=1 Tax=Tegillarca granosa TaxID=220873 RepID=A0ABQ9EGZ6_TEGGR|nr:hypothetical protein KUTeg_019096 [Tegillarca granosa]